MFYYTRSWAELVVILGCIKAEMDETTRNAEAIKADIKALRNRFVVIDATDRCTQCQQALLSRQFYVFPCQHTFHADCLIGLVSSCNSIIFPSILRS